MYAREGMEIDQGIPSDGKHSNRQLRHMVVQMPCSTLREIHNEGRSLHTVWNTVYNTSDPIWSVVCHFEHSVEKEI